MSSERSSMVDQLEEEESITALRSTKELVIKSLWLQYSTLPPDLSKAHVA